MLNSIGSIKQTFLKSDGDDLKKSLFFLFITVFLFTGCEKELTVHSYFYSKVYISSQDLSVKGDFKRNNNGNICFKVTSPENLKGYTYNVEDNSVKMTFQGLDCTYSIEQLQDNAPIKIIKNILDEFDNSKSLLKNEGDCYKLKVQDYIVKVNNSGYIDSISNSDMHITFVNSKPIT